MNLPASLMSRAYHPADIAMLARNGHSVAAKEDAASLFGSASAESGPEVQCLLPANVNRTFRLLT